MKRETDLPAASADVLVEDDTVRLTENRSRRMFAPRQARDGVGPAPRKVLTVFGTRPEVIKLAPVIRQIESRPEAFQAVNVASGQHTDLLYPFARFFNVPIDFDLRVMRPGQTPNQVCARVLFLLEPVLSRERPDLVLVQGDTTTALAGALAAFHQRIPVGHVEAGLRSGDPANPYPEEVNRRLISLLTTYHFAATPRNAQTLRAEGVPAENLFITGNPVVDSLKAILDRPLMSSVVGDLLRDTEGLKRLILTTHRRESFGEVLVGNLWVLRGFVERHADVALVFPVHPNPAVRGPAHEILAGSDRIWLVDPLDYVDFIGLLRNAWLIVSDSGGIQEEAPSLGKPLLVLRETTERPEAIEAGVARLVGGRPERLRALLEAAYRDPRWVEEVSRVANPFGRGDSGQRIVEELGRLLAVRAPQRVAA